VNIGWENNNVHHGIMPPTTFRGGVACEIVGFGLFHSADGTAREYLQGQCVMAGGRMNECVLDGRLPLLTQPVIGFVLLRTAPLCWSPSTYRLLLQRWWPRFVCVFAGARLLRPK